jgi:hypothetical protein
MMAMPPQPRMEFYGNAPSYPPPSYYAPFYVEHSTGRHMKWDPHGWYYITPPLPMGPPPQQLQYMIHQPPSHYQPTGQYRKPRGGNTRRNRRRSNNTRKNI